MAKIKNPTELPILGTLEKEELIKLVEELQEEKLLREAFGHISETGSNDAALMWRGRNRFLAEQVQPVVISPVKEKSYPKRNGGEHRIIDGDNLAVMRSLLTEFRGGPKTGFDVIYMDPPYNTGTDTFAYNDNYNLSKAELDQLKKKVRYVEKGVSLDDPSKHTKWINHIAPRLWAARKLMKHTGVIIVSIDEHELPRLWMLMEEMFGEKNRLATLIWERSRKNDASYFSEGHEYLLVWARDERALNEKMKVMATLKEWERAKGKWRKRKDGADEILMAYAEAKLAHNSDVSKIQLAMNEWFKALPQDHPARKNRYKKIDEEGMFNDDGDLNWPGGGGPRYDVIHPVTKKPCKVPASGWRFPDPADMEALIKAGKIAFKKTHAGVPRLKKYLHESDLEVATSVFKIVGQRAVDTVEKLLGKNVFDSPKDHEMLAELFNLVTWRDKEARIFDPYGGSGTTGHAVLAMNAEDGGNRRFILVESGDPRNKKIPKKDYTDRLTAERIRRVITGKWADGKAHPKLPGSFTFYTAHKAIDKAMLMASDRENLADIILQIVEEDSNRQDCRFEGYEYLIGKTRLGYGIALVWEQGRMRGHQPLTRDIRSKIMAEAEQAGVTKPVYIYAVANTSPQNDKLYRFQQIPDSLLARLNLLEEEENND
ncbi:MAG: site-specific DNA-methyltransferase [Bacteroidetes bacterium]|nr:site-specific DNA-methyltransferase [Bacteroidota bacterium]